MANVDIDHLYDIVAKGSPTKQELFDMIEAVDHTASFGSPTFTVDDLYLKISQHPHADDKLIEALYQSQVENYRGEPIPTSKILDNGSKKLFDKLWGDENTHGKWIKMWRSTHADSKQLENFWNSAIKKDGKGIDPHWIKSLKNEFFRHPNAPKKILHRQLRNKESLLNLALNPNLDGKAFDAVCDYARVYKHDGIFENLTRNMSLDWKKIANGIDLKMQVRDMMGGGILSMSDRRKEAMMDFFLRPDCPEDVKGKLFEITGDERLAPQAVKDMFIF
jgi:hypothetical protein